MNREEKTEYLRSVLADRMDGFDRDAKFGALVKLVSDEFNKLVTEEKVAFSLLFSGMAGTMAEEAIAEMAAKHSGN